MRFGCQVGTTSTNRSRSGRLLSAGFSPADDVSASAAAPVFYNTIGAPEGAVRRRITIEAISHPEVGSLKAIRTEQFGIYEFVDVASNVYQVEAEQGPGSCYDHDVKISDWSVRVQFRDADLGE